MKTTSKYDPFEIQTCLGGFAKWLQYAREDLYIFCYYITFKDELRAYHYTFNDPFEKGVDYPSFFETINDPIVKHCLKTDDTLYYYYKDFIARNCLLEEFVFDERSLVAEAYRYAPTFLPSLKRKSYTFMKITYERYLDEIINTIYYYCCVLTLNSYLIPKKMRVNLEYSHQGSFKYLNIENREVNLLTKLILELISVQDELKK